MKRGRVITIEPDVEKTAKAPKGKKGIIITEPVGETKEQPKAKWLVLSGGITLLRDRNKSYGKGETFEADEDEIPMAFRDLIKPLSPPSVKPVREQPKYSLQPVVPTAEEEDEDDHVPLYEIINARGKVISEKPLPKDEADELLKGLNK